jgi:Ala-tRNA(Pro) deacylase
MNALHRCQKYLTQNGIRYAHSIHAPAYAGGGTSAERMPVRDLARVVAYHSDNGYGMLVLPADCTVDFGKVRRQLGLSEIRLATDAELREVFPGCETGALPPLGSLFNLPVLVDERVAKREFIAFSAGTYQDVIRTSFSDFQGLVNPPVAAFAERTPFAIAS